MTHPDDDFDSDAFDAAFAKQFGEPLAEHPTEETAAGPVEEPASEPAVRTLIAMVLTPVADAAVLAKLMGMVKLTWPVFPTRTGAATATILEVDELAQLTGSAPPEAVRVAQALSRTSEFGVVLLTSRVGQGDEGATGQIHATRFVGGAEVEQLAPGVVLAGVDAAVERVLFGQVAPDRADGVLDPAEVAAREDTEPPRPKRRWGRKSR